MNTSINTARLHRVFQLFAVIYGIGTVLVSSINYILLLNFLNPTFAIGAVFLLIAGVIRWRQCSQSAVYYLFAWMFLLFGALSTSLGHLGVLPRSFISELRGLVLNWKNRLI